jgi:hypothetical protein
MANKQIVSINHLQHLFRRLEAANDALNEIQMYSRGDKQLESEEVMKVRREAMSEKEAIYEVHKGDMLNIISGYLDSCGTDTNYDWH